MSCHDVNALILAIGVTFWSYQMFYDDDNATPWLMEKLVAKPELVNSIEIVLLLIFLGSYLICDGFFNTYSMAISTIFICFLEDLERNDGSAQKPYFMSKSLMKIMGKKNESSGKASLTEMK